MHVCLQERFGCPRDFPLRIPALRPNAYIGYADTYLGQRATRGACSGAAGLTVSDTGRRRPAGWNTPSDRRLVWLATVAGVAWTLTIALTIGLVIQHGEATSADQAAIQAEAAVGRTRDTLATLSRTSSTTVDGDVGTRIECPRVAAVRSLKGLPQQAPYSADVLLGPSPASADMWLTRAVAGLARGSGERGAVRRLNGAAVYQLVTALPKERCSACHPHGSRFPLAVVTVPLQGVQAAGLTDNGLSFGGFGVAWLLGVAFVTYTVQDFRRTAGDMRRLREDHLTFFDESPSVAFLVGESGDGTFDPIVRANRRASEELGAPAKEFVGMDLPRLIDRLDDVTQRALIKTLKARGQVIMETTLLSRDRLHVPVEAEFSVFEYEAAPTILVFLRDLGDRRTAESALARRDRRLHLISLATRRLAEHLDERLVLRELVASAMEIVSATGGIAGLIVGEEVVFTESVGLDGRESIDFHVPLDGGVAGHVVEIRAPYLTNDAPRDPYLMDELRERADFLALLAVPILDSAGVPIGVLEMYDQVHGPFDDEDALALMGVAASAGVAIENARVVKQLLAMRQQLLDHQAELRQLAEELSVVQERERRTIAVELHDGVGQNLALLRMKIGQAAKTCEPQSAALFEDTRELLEDTIAQTRSLTFQLAPPVLYELGLGPALEWLSEQLTADHPTDFVFVENGEPLSLSDDNRSLLYAAAREVMLNVVKHAEATEARVSVCWSEQDVRIEIVDDGKGLPSEGDTPRRAGYGLFGVRERLRSLGGLLQLNSEPGQGTTAWIDVPLATDVP